LNISAHLPRGNLPFILYVSKEDTNNPAIIYDNDITMQFTENKIIAQ
jgi:hypothetical protein